MGVFAVQMTSLQCNIFWMTPKVGTMTKQVKEGEMESKGEKKGREGRKAGGRQVVGK